MSIAADTPIDLRARRLVTAGLMMAMAVLALEVTVVTTALPTVVGELDRIDLYAWVFSAYLLTSTVTVPLFGKLSDTYGRRNIFLLGMVLFLLGSALCGLARGMSELIVFRAIQGLGAGAAMPTIFTVLADIYRLEERARIQGLFSGLWGIASLAGPALGAWLTLTFSWRAVFFVGIPFGLAALVLIGARLREQVERKPRQLDLVGFLLLSASLATVILVATQGLTALMDGSPLAIGALAVGLGLAVAFVLIEPRVSDPVLPPHLFKIRVMVTSSVCNFLSGAVLFGVTSFVPLYVQGVLGETAAGAGAVLTPMLVGWAVSGLFGPRLLLRSGFRVTALFSTGLISAGAIGLAMVSAETPKLLLFASVTAMGVGFGPGQAAFVMAVQEAVPWNMRGAATSTTQLFRSLGGTLGVALMGGVLQAGIARTGSFERYGGALLDPHQRSELPLAVLSSMQAVLGASMRPVFFIVLALAIATLLAVLVLDQPGKDPISARPVDDVTDGVARPRTARFSP